MLRHLNEKDASLRIQKAVGDTIAEGKILTPDLGGKATTTQYTDALIAHIEQ